MDQIGKSMMSVAQHSALPNKDFKSAQDLNCWILERVNILCICYRKSDANEPQGFAAAAATALSDYPTDIIEFITDPRTGLPSKIKWLPSIAEIHEACREIAQQRAEAAKRARDLKLQFAERDKFEAEQLAKKNHPPLDEIEKMIGRVIEP